MEHSYPKETNPNDVFTQDTLDRLTTSLLSWQQGPGNFGGLHLHACWGETSVLTRRYQGQTTYTSKLLLEGAMRLFEATRDPRWKRLAQEIIANLLFLQARNGGFIHAASEAEPAYVPEITCPIHQFLPIVALLEYAAWPHADADLQPQIRPAIDRHWEWSLKQLWRSGNAMQRRPLGFPGWCGVTNQDLVAIASLAMYAQVYGDSSRFVEFGKPSLEVYLGPKYYHPQIGLMERGDSVNFVERTPYYDWILAMLEKIRVCTGDDRLWEVTDNIGCHLFDALFTGNDGQLHLSWGAQTSPDDRTSVPAWIKAPITLGAYPTLIRLMRRYLARHPDRMRAAQVAELERTVACYVFADGTLPGALGAKDPLFSIVTSPASGSIGLWLFLLERLGDKVRSPAHAPSGCIHRTNGVLTWKSNDRMWAIEQAGQRMFAGLKLNPGAIAIGPQETIAGADFQELERCDIRETIVVEKR